MNLRYRNFCHLRWAALVMALVLLIAAWACVVEAHHGVVPHGPCAMVATAAAGMAFFLFLAGSLAAPAAGPSVSGRAAAVPDPPPKLALSAS